MQKRIKQSPMIGHLVSVDEPFYLLVVDPLRLLLSQFKPCHRARPSPVWKIKSSKWTSSVNTKYCRLRRYRGRVWILIEPWWELVRMIYTGQGYILPPPQKKK